VLRDTSRGPAFIGGTPMRVRRRASTGLAVRYLPVRVCANVMNAHGEALVSDSLCRCWFAVLVSATKRRQAQGQIAPDERPSAPRQKPICDCQKWRLTAPAAIS